MSETDNKLPLPDLESGAEIMPPAVPEPDSADHNAADLELLRLGRGAVVELDRKVGEAIDIYVNNRLVARGEVVLVEDKLGITMTEIIKAERS